MKIIGKIIEDKNIEEFKGDLALLITVNKDTDTYDGRISRNNNVDGFDYITLAKVVIAQCYKNAIENGLDPNSTKVTIMQIINEL